MANRFVYRSLAEAPFAMAIPVEFVYYNGFSLAQKQRTIDSLHKSYLENHPDDRVIEVSTKGRDPFGVALSAFNLIIETPRRSFSVECAFQGSKVFELGGPYDDLLNVDSRSAKKDPRIRNSGKVIGFRFHGVDYPTRPLDLFYNWLYINALNRQERLLQEACAYNAFTDIEFNPSKSINCQALALARAVGLAQAGKLDLALGGIGVFTDTLYGEQADEGADGELVQGLTQLALFN